MRGEKFRTFRGYSLMDKKKNLTPSMEDYIEMLYRLTRKEKYVRLTDLASALSVKPSSASKMIRRLEEKSYVDNRKQGFIELTKPGEDLGAAFLSRHDLIETFLRLFGVRNNILKDTERIEHIISDEFLERISLFNAFAKENPSWLARFLSL